MAKRYPDAVPDVYCHTLGRLSKASLMEICWDLACSLAPSPDSGPEAIIEIIFTSHRALNKIRARPARDR